MAAEKSTQLPLFPETGIEGKWTLIPYDFAGPSFDARALCASYWEGYLAGQRSCAPRKANSLPTLGRQLTKSPIQSIALEEWFNFVPERT